MCKVLSSAHTVSTHTNATIRKLVLYLSLLPTTISLFLSYGILYLVSSRDRNNIILFAAFPAVFAQHLLAIGPYLLYSIYAKQFTL